MRTRLLIVSADPEFRVGLARFFRAEGYGVEVAESTSQVRRLGTKPALAILGLSGRERDLRELAGELRAATARPVVTVRRSGATVPDAVDASDGPAMLARVAEALAPPRARNEPVLSFAGYRLDPNGHSLAGPDDSEIILTRGEFRLLHELARRAGRVASRDDLLQAMSGRQAESYDRSVDMLIGRLRRKIEPDAAHPSLIITVPGTGYKFVPSVRSGDAPAAATRGEIALQSGRTAPETPLEHLGRRQLAFLYAELVANGEERLPVDPEDLQPLLEEFREW